MPRPHDRFHHQQYQVRVWSFSAPGTIYLQGDDWDPEGYELWQNSAGCWQVYKETDVHWPWTDGLRHLV
jgi:hypothetical protein